MGPRGKYTVKINEKYQYKTPQEYVKNRLNSEYLQFMNYQEIENIANMNYEEYLAKVENAKNQKA